MTPKIFNLIKKYVIKKILIIKDIGGDELFEKIKII